MNPETQLLDPQQQALLAQVTRVVVGVGLAWFTVHAMRLTASSAESWTAVRAAIRSGAQIMVLRVLLPATAVLTLVQQHTGAQAFAILFGLGFALTVVLFFFFFAIYSVASKHAVWNAGAAASMGGGNRGLAVLLLLSGLVFTGPTAGPQIERTTAAFLAIDLGNFLALLAALPFLMSLLARGKSADGVPVPELISTNLYQARWDLVPIFAAVVTYLAVNAFGEQSWVTAVVRQIGTETADIRSVLVLYLAWLYVFATLPSLSAVRHEFPHAVMLALLRVGLASLAAVAGAALLGFSSPLAFATSPYGLATLLLLLSPVSSFASIIIKQAGADEQAEARVSELVLASTIVFLIVALILALGAGFLDSR